MEDASQYTKRDKLVGLNEVLRVYYDPKLLTLELFMLLELQAGIDATNNNWKLFKVYKSKQMGEFVMLGKN